MPVNRDLTVWVYSVSLSMNTIAPPIAIGENLVVNFKNDCHGNKTFDDYVIEHSDNQLNE